MEHNFKELISQMTLEEKAGMCSGADFWHLKNVERLGIPTVMVSDGPHGLRKQDEKADHLGVNESIKAVCFPPACLSACSFDRDLMESFGEAIGKEAQATEVSVVLGPAVNIKRSPLCGRNFEYYSEDPYLTGEIAASFITGVQSQKIGTSIKHFAANNQEYHRMSCSSEVDLRTLREIYLPAFETAVKKSQPYTVMCSYNRLNGTYASENEWLLTDVLRKEWGFDGYVVSDWGAVNDRVAGIKAGLDLEMPSSNGINDKEIVDAVKNGTLAESVLDQAVERILRIIFTYYDNRQSLPLDLEGDHEKALHIAEESMVLLKNENQILPLSSDKKIAFIGEFAKKPRFQGGGSSHINSFQVSNALAAAAQFADVSYAKGFSAKQDVYEETLAQEAIALAKNSDTVVVFAGLPDSFESEGYDRTHMDLPACQNRLINELLDVNSNVVVVLHNGSPVTMPWLSSVKGLLEAYLGGQAGGAAVANILFGQVNPSGKLAETIPYKLSDNPSYLNFGGGKKVNYYEGVFVGYRYYATKEMPVAFPFGYGLSYTSFSYSNLTVTKDSICEKDSLSVSVDVTNTGKIAGKEIVQLYISDQTHACNRPVRELKGFDKVALAPGETKTVTFSLDMRSFAWYNEEIMDWYAADGNYQIEIGTSAMDICLTKEIAFTNTTALPLHVTANTTVGELLANRNTRDVAKKLLDSLSSIFGGNSESSSEAITDEMNQAMLDSMPLRGLISFGVITKEELLDLIKKVR